MRILFITYHFPPARSVGGLRARNFARGLPSFGITPTVITARNGMGIEGHEALRGMESIKVIRTGSLPTLSGAYVAMKRLLARRRVSRGTAPAISSPPVSHTAAGGRGLLRKYILSLFLALPDTERNWVLPAVLASLREIRSGGIDCIFSTCPPYSVHIAGLLVKSITGVKWIADFRDPWMTTGSKRLYPTTPASLRVERWLEKKVVQKADLVTFNVERLMEAYRERYASKDDGKFVHIPNAFDPELFALSKGIKKYKTFTLSYTGSMYLGRTPEPVFKAIARLMEMKRIKKGQISLRFAGSCSHARGRPLEEIAARYGLGDMVAVSDGVPYNRAIEIIARSHMALVLAPDQPYQIPAKVYDYMGAGARVLAVAGPGATFDFVKKAGIGGAFHPDDIEGIADFICREYKNGPSLTEKEKVEEYRIGRVTERLVRSLPGI